MNYRIKKTTGEQFTVNAAKQSNGLYTVKVEHYDRQGYLIAHESRELIDWTLDKLTSVIDFMRPAFKVIDC